MYGSGGIASCIPNLNIRCFSSCPSCFTLGKETPVSIG